MQGFKRSARNEQAIPEQCKWAWERDDWPAWQRAERKKLHWRIYCAILDQRYEDISDIDDAVIAEQRHLQQQWDWAVQEGRGYAAHRFSDAIHRNLDDYILFCVIAHSHNGQGQRTTPNRPHQQLPMQPGVQIAHGPALDIPDEVIRVAHTMMQVTAAPVPAKQEQMDNVVADKRCKGKSLVLRITHGPTLTVADDIVPAVPTMLGVKFTPALQLDNMPSLQEQFDRALLEQRFEDLPGLQEAMRAEHGGVQPQLALAINEERCLDAAHFCDAIARSVEEQMDIAVSDTTCRGESPGFRLPHGPILVLAADSIRAAPKMLGAAAAPAAAKQDNVGNEVHDNMCKGDISGHDYDMGDGMSTEADKLKALFADEDAMGGWTNFGQLPAWGHGAGGGDTWDPGPPPPFASSRASRTLEHVMSFQNVPWGVSNDKCSTTKKAIVTSV